MAIPEGASVIYYQIHIHDPNDTESQTDYSMEVAIRMNSQSSEALFMGTSPIAVQMIDDALAVAAEQLAVAALIEYPTFVVASNERKYVVTRGVVEDETWPPTP